jgi:hypothetical protein
MRRARRLIRLVDGQIERDERKNSGDLAAEPTPEHAGRPADDPA